MLSSRRLYRRAVLVLVLPLLLSALLLSGERDRIVGLIEHGRLDSLDPAARAERIRTRAAAAAQAQLGEPIYPPRPEARMVKVTRMTVREVQVGDAIAKVQVPETVEERVEPSPDDLAAWRRRQLDIDVQHGKKIEALTAEFIADRTAAEKRGRQMTMVGLALPGPALFFSLLLFLRARRVAREERELYEEEMAFLSTPTPR